MSTKSTKKIAGFIKLQIPAGKASPAPPVGPALGQKGLNQMEFCKAFNDATKTKYDAESPVRVAIIAYKDKTFTFKILGNPASYLIRKALKLEKGSTAPGRTSIGTITQEQLKAVAEEKMKQGLSARNVEQAMKIIAGSARSMGLKIVGAENG